MSNTGEMLHSALVGQEKRDLKLINAVLIKQDLDLNPIKPRLFEICQTRGGGGIHPHPITPLFEG